MLIVQQPMAGRVSVALAGDQVGFIANGTGTNPTTQVYRFNLASGALVQATSHFSAKDGLQMAPSGRMVWRDSLFDSYATFVWLP